MSKVHLLSDIITKLQNYSTQNEKLGLLHTYHKEPILQRIITIAYNPWIDFGMQDFVPRRKGKQGGRVGTEFRQMLTYS